MHVDVCKLCHLYFSHENAAHLNPPELCSYTLMRIVFINTFVMCTSIISNMQNIEYLHNTKYHSGKILF